MKLFLVTFAVLSLAMIGHGYAIEDEPEFSDIDLFTRFPISDEFIKCIRKGVTKIVDKNRDIDWWFKDIVKTAWRLIAEEGLDCAIKSGLSQELCLLKLKSNVEKEVQRIVKELPEENRGLAKNLKELIMKCFP